VRTNHNIRLSLLDSLPYRLHILCISGMNYRVALFELFDDTADQARGTLGSGIACALCEVILQHLFELARCLTSLYGPLGDIVRRVIVYTEVPSTTRYIDGLPLPGRNRR